MIKRLTIFYRDGSTYTHRNVTKVTDDVGSGVIIIDRGQLTTNVDGNNTDIQNHILQITSINRGLVSGYMVERDDRGEDVITINRISKSLSVKPFVANTKKTTRK